MCIGDQWFRFNDSEVTLKDNNKEYEIKGSNSAYLVFYRKRIMLPYNYWIDIKNLIWNKSK